MANSNKLFDSEKAWMNGKALLLCLGGIAAGSTFAALVLPTWLPALVISASGPNPQVYWFLSRGSALVAYSILWFSMLFGLLITNKVARVWPGGPRAFDLHQFLSLLGLGLALFHGLILMGDRYINFSFIQVLIPFDSQNYRPLWVGIGQIAFYFWGIIVFSFYVRKKIGNRTWRLLHYASFITFLMAMIHGVTAGTDTSTGG